jgi:aspartyl-tRNA(Asn)/glutamyl-tRNA(Gln) amidotransferase subunit A
LWISFSSPQSHPQIINSVMATGVEFSTMTTAALHELDALALAALIRTGSVSAREVITATLARIDALNPTLNAFITIAHDKAVREADLVDQRLARGEPVGRLAGVPLHVKDLVATRDVRTTYASFIHEHNVPKTSAVSVARLEAEGAIVVGKTTTPEFGHMCWTEAPLFGRTGNAWDQTRTAGGSSGGAAVATIMGLGALGIATCAGGSTRIPAAANGVVGFKQSLGLVPHDGAPEAFANLSYITPITRTVAETALMLDIMGGPHPADPHSFGMSTGGCLAAALKPPSLKGLRVGFRPFLGNTVIDPHVLAAVQRAVKALSDLGAEVIEQPDDMEPTEPFWLVISTALWNARFAHLLPEWRGRMSKTLLQQMDRGQQYTATDLQRASLERTRLYRKIQMWFDDVDILVMPTLTRTAVSIDEALYEPIIIDGRVTDTVRKAWYPYTHPFNLSGNPAVTLPLGLHPDGLPMGIQFVGPRGSDAKLCGIASVFEAAQPWSHLKPLAY